MGRGELLQRDFDFFYLRASPLHTPLLEAFLRPGAAFPVPRAAGCWCRGAAGTFLYRFPVALLFLGSHEAMPFTAPSERKSPPLPRLPDPAVGRCLDGDARERGTAVGLSACKRAGDDFACARHVARVPGGLGALLAGGMLVGCWSGKAG